MMEELIAWLAKTGGPMGAIATVLWWQLKEANRSRSLNDEAMARDRDEQTKELRSINRSLGRLLEVNHIVEDDTGDTVPPPRPTRRTPARGVKTREGDR